MKTSASPLAAFAQYCLDADIIAGMPDWVEVRKLARVALVAPDPAEQRGWARAIEAAAQIFDARAANVRAEADAACITRTQDVLREIGCAKLIRELANGR